MSLILTVWFQTGIIKYCKKLNLTALQVKVVTLSLFLLVYTYSSVSQVIGVAHPAHITGKCTMSCMDRFTSLGKTQLVMAPLLLARFSVFL